MPWLPEEEQLNLYALFKQAVKGTAPQRRPQGSRRAEAKWAAWRQLAGTPKIKAAERYVEEVGRVFPSWDEPEELEEPEEEDDLLQAEWEEGGGRGSLFGGDMGVMSTMMRDMDFEEEGEDDLDALLTDLSRAAKEDDPAAIREILEEEGDDIEERDAEGRSALHWACDFGALKAAEELLEQGADPCARDDEGASPLHYACLCEHEELARVLLQCGADPYLRDLSGERPADLAPEQWSFLA